MVVSTGASHDIMSLFYNMSPLVYPLTPIVEPTVLLPLPGSYTLVNNTTPLLSPDRGECALIV